MNLTHLYRPLKFARYPTKDKQNGLLWVSVRTGFLVCWCPQWPKMQFPWFAKFLQNELLHVLTENHKNCSSNQHDDSLYKVCPDHSSETTCPAKRYKIVSLHTENTHFLFCSGTFENCGATVPNLHFSGLFENSAHKPAIFKGHGLAWNWKSGSFRRTYQLLWREQQ